MPIAALTLGAGTAIAGAIGGGTAIASGAIQARAHGKAAKLQTQSANYAADRQLESSKAAEAFQRQQAQATWVNQEGDRRANYDQWAARERRLGSVADALGYGQREIPGYVASIDPQFQSGAGPMAGPTPS